MKTKQRYFVFSFPAVGTVTCCGCIKWKRNWHGSADRSNGKRMRSQTAVPAILQPATQIPPGAWMCSAGRRNTVSSICVATHGTGRNRTPMDTISKENEKCCIWTSFANVLGRNVTASSILWSKIRRFWRKNTSLLMFTKREKYDKLMVTDDEIQRRIRTLRSFVICSAWRECPEATKAVPPYAGWIGSAYWGRSKTSIQDWARRGTPELDALP